MSQWEVNSVDFLDSCTSFFVSKFCEFLHAGPRLDFVGRPRNRIACDPCSGRSGVQALFDLLSFLQSGEMEQ